MSAAGGVGRSTLSALLAYALHEHTVDGWGRAVAICDTRPRGASPWPGWLDHHAQCGTGWLAGYADDARKFAREVRRSTSAVDAPDGRPIWVLTDSGPLSPAFSGAAPGPAFWAPVLPYVRAAVIDGDGLEGFRLARQHAGGESSTASDWIRLPSVRTAALWVTDMSPAGMARTLAAMTAAESCGLPTEQIVVAVNDPRGHGWAARSRSRRTLLADRVGAIVEIGHDADLRRDGRPSITSGPATRRDITALVNALVTAAGRPEPGPAGVSEPALAPAERTSWHVVPAQPVPAGS